MHPWIKETIEKLEKEHGAKPFLWQIEQATNIPQQYLTSHLKDYPKELLISINEKKVLDVYDGSMSYQVLSDLTGLKYQTTMKVFKRLEEKGLVAKKSLKKYTKDSKEGLVYVKVIRKSVIEAKTERGKKVELIFSGCCGYLEKIMHEKKKDRLVVFKDSKPYKIDISPREYEVVGG